MSSRRMWDRLGERYITARMPSVTVDEMYLVSTSHEFDVEEYGTGNKEGAVESTLESIEDMLLRSTSLPEPANGGMVIETLKPTKLSLTARARIKRERFDVRSVLNTNPVRLDYTHCGCSICERYDRIPQLT